MVVGEKKEKQDVVHVGSNKNICLICGSEVPEGREVCPICEKAILLD